MNHQRWECIEDLLQRALDLEPSERSAFLDETCGSDQTLRAEIEELLCKEVEAEGFLESPAVVCVAEQIIGASNDLPDQITHYHIESRIGSGGMGEVYKARDETLQRVVALKMLPAEFTSDNERVQRFEQEAFAASRLNHPNIITIFEITHVSGTHFIAEEFVEGQTLRQMLIDPQTKKTQKLPVEKALEITIQIAGAIKAAHTAWIIHRDIKPENIMVRNDGLVKVLDFGIAKLNQDDNEDSEKSGPGEESTSPPLASSFENQLTTPGMIVGTASYMSPEQARGEALDGRSDIFSLGLLLHEMVTGERLFAGATRVAALRAVELVEEIVSRNARLGHVPAELQRIIRRMLRRNRDERYASASDLLDDLHRLKRRLENRTTRRMVGLSAVAAAAGIALTAIAALLSVNEVWEEKILSDGHTAAVRRAVFSPDGRLLISGGEDHQVIVWDFARRERLKTLTDHTGIVNAVSFSPDGKWFATASEDRSVIIWDALRLERANVLREHGLPVRTVSFSPYGHLLVASSANVDGVGLTVVWETDSWRKVRTLPFGQYSGNHAFLDNNRWLVENSGRIWNLTTGAFEDERAHPLGNWLAISPDGRRWAGVDSKGKVNFIDRAQPKSATTHKTHHDHGRSIEFSPDGRWLASAAERVVLWDAKTLTRLAPLEYDSIVWSVAFSPDARWLVSTHGDGSILIWDLAQRELAANLKQHSGAIRAVAFSPDGERLASASDDHDVIVWNLSGGYKEAVLVGHQTRVTAVAFSPDGQWLASTDQDGIVIQWDQTSRSPRRKITPPEGAYSYCLAISPTGKHVALTNAVYELETGRNIVISGSAWSHVYSAVFTSDGKLIGATDYGALLVADAENWRMIEQHKWSDSALVTLSLSSDGEHLITGEDGKTVRFGSLKPFRQLGVIGKHEARIKAVAFSPDGERVASAGDDKLIKLWDIGNRKLITTVGTHSSPVYSLAFSPDGQRLVSGEHDRSLRVYTRYRQLWGFRLD